MHHRKTRARIRKVMAIVRARAIEFTGNSDSAIFTAPKKQAINSIESGSAMRTRSPGLQPESSKARATRFTHSLVGRRSLRADSQNRRFVRILSRRARDEFVRNIKYSEGDGEEARQPPILHQQAILALHLNCWLLAGEHIGASRFHRHKSEARGLYCVADFSPNRRMPPAASCAGGRASD